MQISANHIDQLNATQTMTSVWTYSLDLLR